MNSILRFLKVTALGAWVGSIIYFAVITQGIFSVLSRDQAGVVVGYALGRLHTLGSIAAIIFLVASLLLSKSVTALFRLASLGVILMLLLTLASQRLVISRMDALRVQMGSVDATPPSDPARSEFDRLHSVSVYLEGAVLVVGLISLFLTANEKRP